MKLPVLALAAAALAPACVLTEDQSPETGSVIQETGKCPDWVCETNSPVIDSLNFHDLSMLGIENDKHLRIIGFYKPNDTFAYRVLVRDGRLYAADSNGNPVYGGQTLVGMWIRIQNTTNGKLFDAYVRTVKSVNPYYAVDPMYGQQYFESYKIEVIPQVPGATVSNLCNHPHIAREPDDLNVPGEDVVLFEGERISSDTMTIGSAMDRNWFNIGCAGHVLAKMHATGHTHAAEAAHFVTTIAERQTLLRMFAADYCGIGYGFTLPGQPLTWMDDRNWMHEKGVVTGIEARWTPSGARCLEQSRISAHPSAMSQAYWPQNVSTAEITAICKNYVPNYVPLPSCSTLYGDADPTHLFGMHLVSANIQ